MPRAARSTLLSIQAAAKTLVPAKRPSRPRQARHGERWQASTGAELVLVLVTATEDAISPEH